MEKEGSSRSLLTVAQRIQVIQELEGGSTASDVALRYGVHPCTIRRIKRQSAALYQFSQQVGGHRKKIITANCEKLDSRMNEWVAERRAMGDPISGPIVQQVALSLNAAIGGPQDFKASNGWLSRFKQRHGIRRLSLQGEKKSADHEAATAFVDDDEEHPEDSGHDEDEEDEEDDEDPALAAIGITLGEEKVLIGQMKRWASVKSDRAQQLMQLLLAEVGADDS